MTDSATLDPKQKAILDAAWEVFAAYGFRKTSMDDIARSAGISRPALYLHYKNKQDIFRSLTCHLYDQGLARFSERLQQDGPIGDVLTQAFVAKTRPYAETMMNSQHGNELIDVNKTTAADIVAEGEARLIATLADWLEAQAQLGRVALPVPAAEVARLCELTVVGLIMASEDSEAFFRDVATFCGLLGRGLSTD